MLSNSGNRCLGATCIVTVFGFDFVDQEKNLFLKEEINCSHGVNETKIENASLGFFEVGKRSIGSKP